MVRQLINPATGNYRTESLPTSVNEAFNILEPSNDQSNQQRQAIMCLYQLTLDAHQAETLAFHEASDEALALKLLDCVDALAVAPIFDDDMALFQDALRVSCEVVRLINAGRLKALANCGGA